MELSQRLPFGKLEYRNIVADEIRTHSPRSLITKHINAEENTRENGSPLAFKALVGSA